jgi:hypothetical protein
VTDLTDTDAIRRVAIQCVAELGRGVAILEEEIVHGAPATQVAETLRSLRVLVDVVGNVMHADGRPL